MIRSATASPLTMVTDRSPVKTPIMSRTIAPTASMSSGTES